MHPELGLLVARVVIEGFCYDDGNVRPARSGAFVMLFACGVRLTAL